MTLFTREQEAIMDKGTEPLIDRSHSVNISDEQILHQQYDHDPNRTIYRQPAAHGNQQYMQMPQKGYPPNGVGLNSTNQYTGFGHVMSPDDELLVVESMQPPRDWLALSIVVLILCCMPIGVASLVFSVKTRSAIKYDDLPAAKDASRKARILGVVGLGVGLVFNTLFIIFSVVGL